MLTDTKTQLITVTCESCKIQKGILVENPIQAHAAFYKLGWKWIGEYYLCGRCVSRKRGSDG